MWLFTRYGFFSIACARQGDGRSPHADPNLLMVRARQQRHLERLQARFSELRTAEIVADRNTDYRYRIFVPKAVWAELVAELAAEQTWPNFKEEAERFLGADDADYIDALHRVWA